MFVNKILGSVYFWLAIGGLGLLLLLRKGAASKALKIIKILGSLLLKLLDLVFAVFNLRFTKIMNFEEIKEV